MLRTAPNATCFKTSSLNALNLSRSLGVLRENIAGLWVYQHGVGGDPETVQCMAECASRKLGRNIARVRPGALQSREE